MSNVTPIRRRPAELPQALADHLAEQQQRIAELQNLLERLADDDDTPICLDLAARAAAEVNEALDSMTLGKVLEGRSEEAAS